MSKSTTSRARLIGRGPRGTIQIEPIRSGVLGAASKAGAAKRYAVAPAVTVKRAATDRRVRRESRRAAANAALAWRRAERVGLSEAFTDRKVTRRMRLAQRHMSRAVAFSISPPPRHRLRNAALVLAGMGASSAALAATRHLTPAARPSAEDGSTAANETTATFRDEHVHQRPSRAEAT